MAGTNDLSEAVDFLKGLVSGHDYREVQLDLTPEMEVFYRVTKVLRDTDFVDFKMRFAPEGQTGGEFINYRVSHSPFEF